MDGQTVGYHGLITFKLEDGSVRDVPFWFSGSAEIARVLQVQVTSIAGQETFGTPISAMKLSAMKQVESSAPPLAKEQYELKHPEHTYPPTAHEPGPDGERIIVDTDKFHISPGREGRTADHPWTEIIVAPRVKE